MWAVPFVSLVPFSVRVFKGLLLCNCDVLCTACSSWVESIHCCTGGALWKEGALDRKCRISEFLWSYYLRKNRRRVFTSFSRASFVGELDVLQAEFWELLVVSWPPASKSPVVRMEHDDGTAASTPQVIRRLVPMEISLYCSLCRGIFRPNYTCMIVVRMRWYEVHQFEWKRCNMVLDGRQIVTR